MLHRETLNDEKIYITMIKVGVHNFLAWLKSIDV
jgi:hypothetical protein